MDDNGRFLTVAVTAYFTPSFFAHSSCSFSGYLDLFSFLCLPTYRGKHYCGQ